MKKKNILIISLIFLTVLVIGFLTATFLLKEKPSLPSKATGPSCPADSGSCTWSSDESATSFRVRIIDQTTNTTILNKITSDKKVDFTPTANHSYKCTVTPINSCGEGEESSDTSTCTVITGTPAPTSTITPTPPTDTTPTITPEVSLTPSMTLTPSPTEEISSTPTPTVEISSTPTPTEETSSTPTPAEDISTTPTRTPTLTQTPTPTRTLTPTPTKILSTTPARTHTPPQGTTSFAEQTEAQPTIPASGTPASWIFILVPLAILLLGLIF